MNTKPSIVLFLMVCMMTLMSCKKAETSTPGTATDARGQFVGNWQVHYTDINYPLNENYVVTITKSLTLAGVVQIDNFMAVNNDSFYIPKQTVANSNVIDGVGVIQGGNRLLFTYSSESPVGDWMAIGIKK